MNTPGQPRPQNTESDDCHSLATRWISDCISTHDQHRDQDRASWLPTRLIDVGSSCPAVEPRIVATSSFLKKPSGPLYISLTHLWAAKSVLRLITTNQEQFMEAVPWEDLAPTLRDAILFTRRLGIRHLWIDSLCILQNSAQDWLAESALMNRVYKHSMCNIAVTAASNGSPGLYQHRDPYPITPYGVRIQRKGHEQSYIYSFGSYHYIDTASCASVNQRGWIL